MRIPSILTLASLSTALLTGSAGCMVGDEGDEGVVDGEIIGGTDDYGDPAVFELRDVMSYDPVAGTIGVKTCTATLIAPTVAISAAHCFDAKALWSDALFGRTPNRFLPPSGTTVYATVIPSPQYGGPGSGENGHDISIVLLSRPIAVAPVRRAPTPPVGAAVRAVGYGASNFDQSGVGNKRQIGFLVTAVNAGVINAGYEGHNLCHGDSGGPTFYAGGITGVNDYVDTADCHGGAHMGRIDINLPFIHLYAPNF